MVTHAFVIASLDRSRVVGTRRVLRRMREIVRLVPLSCDDDSALLLSERDRALLRDPDRTLIGIVLAVEEPRVGEVAVVRDVDPVRAGPHERADDGLREEEARPRSRP